jgi:sulfatase modifying factor 1
MRGGSFKDVGLYIQTGTRSYEYQDTAKCLHRLQRSVTYLGRGKAVNAEDL